jgi:hypothetical protein
VRSRSSTLRFGLESEEHRLAFLAGGKVTRFGGPRARHCGALRKCGAPCRAPALSGRDRCRLHCGGARLPRSPARVEANRQRTLWRADPWAPGATIALPRDEDLALGAELARHGHLVPSLPPAVLDGLRWKWRRAFMDGRDAPAIWRDALTALPKKVAVAGPRLDSALAVPACGPAPYVAAQPPVYSKRSQANAGLVLRRPEDTHAGKRESARHRILEMPQAVRAAQALETHAAALSPILAGFPDEGTRRGLALAYDRLQSGQSDWWGWLDALQAARHR